MNGPHVLVARQFLAQLRERVEDAERERDAALSRVRELEAGRLADDREYQARTQELRAAEADCVSLRDHLARDAVETRKAGCACRGTSLCLYHERIQTALQSPHPGQAILDRLARADAVVEAIANMPCALQRAAEVVGMTTDEKCRRCESCMARAYKGTTKGEEE